LLVLTTTVTGLLGSPRLAHAGQRIAVLEFRGDGSLDESALLFLADEVREAALGVMDPAEWELITRENMLVLLEHNADSLEQCEGECEVETGRLLGAHVVVSGEQVKLGSYQRVRLKVLDTSAGRLLTSTKVEAVDVDALVKELERAGRRLFADLAGASSSKDALVSGDRDVGDGPGAWTMDAKESHIVQFASKPTGASVSVDGSYVCDAPCSRELSQGWHEIRYDLQKYEPVEVEIDVADSTKVNETLTPLFGWLTIETTPSRLSVTLDGESMGRSPLRELVVSPGAHTVLIDEPGYRSTGKEVVVERANEKRVIVEAVPALGGLDVKARDDAGNDLVEDVEIDGVGVGRTPWRGEVQVGEHEVRVGEWSSRVTVAEADVETIVAVVQLAVSGSEQRSGRQPPDPPKEVTAELSAENARRVQDLREIIAVDPLAAQAPELSDQIIDLLWEIERFEEASREIDQFYESYGPGSRWARVNSNEPAVTASALDLAEKNYRKVAVGSFQQAVKRKNRDLLLLAETNYEKYLDYFPDSSKAYEMRFWYAEVLYKFKKYNLAADQYERVVQLDPKGKYLKDAASNTIFSIEKYIGKKQKEWDKEAKALRDEMEQEEDPTRRYALIELNEWERRLVDACDTYAWVLPDEENASKVLYKGAFLLDTRNHFQEANQRYLECIRREPRSETAQYAMHRMLTTYEAIGDWENLAAAARELLDNADVVKSEEFAAELSAIYESALERAR